MNRPKLWLVTPSSVYARCARIAVGKNGRVDANELTSRFAVTRCSDRGYRCVLCGRRPEPGECGLGSRNDLRTDGTRGHVPEVENDMC